MRVTVICPTKNRMAFLQKSIEYFLRQTYTDSEMLILDDSDNRAEIIPFFHPRVKHQIVDSMLLGAKMAYGVSIANTNFIQKWDDDDFYDSRFLDRNVAALCEDDTRIVGRRAFPVMFLGEPTWKICTLPTALAGGTLFFNRKHCPQFRPELWRGVDTEFLRDARHNPQYSLPGWDYVMVRHGRNTWSNAGWDDWLRAKPPYCGSVASIMSGADLAFYRTMKYEREAKCAA